MNHIPRVIVVITLWLTLLFAKEGVTLYNTGELHGALSAPTALATFIAQQKQSQEVVVVDAGGFLAGGVYDVFTGGYRADSLQSTAMWRAMSQVGYSAIGLGDEELQYGASFIISQQSSNSLPLVSANVMIKGSNSAVVPYVIIKKGRQRIAITSVVTSQQILSYGKGVRVSSAKEALDTLIPFLAQKADRIILLAHVGEKNSLAILKKYPQISVVVNGHKKTSAASTEKQGNQVLQNFSFLGEKIAATHLSKTEITPSKQWVSLSQKPLVKTPRTGAVERMDLYIMSSCPYGDQAVLQLLALADNIALDLHVWYMGDITAQGLSPALKGGDINQEMLTIAVGKLYPQRLYDYLWLRMEQKITCEETISELHLDKNKLMEWVKKQGTQELALHYRRSAFLRAVESPTLWIDNRLYTGTIDAQRLLLGACLDGNLSGVACDTLGECLSDNDCPNSDTTIGLCQKGTRGGKCRSQKEPLLTLTTLLPDAPLWTIDENFYKETQELFPTLQTEEFVLDSGSVALFKKVLSQTGRVRLPLIYIDSAITQGYNYAKVKDLFEPCGPYFCLKNDSRPDGYYTTRPYHEGALVLSVDSLMVSDSARIVLKERYTDYTLEKDSLGISYGVWLNNRELFTAPTLESLEELLDNLKGYLDAP